MKRFLFLILFLTALQPFALPAEESEISVKAEVDKAFITIGDPVSYTVTVKHKPSARLLSGIDFKDQDILKIKKVEDFSKKDRAFIYEGRKFTLTAFALGEFVLSPVQIQYADAQGQTQTLQTDPIYITVKSVAEGEEKTDIRGVKSVVQIPAKYLRWVMAGSGTLLFAALALALFYLLRRRSAGISEEERVHNIEDETLSQLMTLFDSDLIRRGKIKEYYLKLSEILKVYFERRFHIPAVEATTFEIQRELKEKETDPALQAMIHEVLEFADLAKFAKWKPEPTEIIKTNQKAKQIVELARPKPEVTQDGI